MRAEGKESSETLEGVGGRYREREIQRKIGSSGGWKLGSRG